MPPLPGPRETLCCTRNPVSTFTCPLSIFVGNDTSNTRFGVRNTWRRPGSSFSTSAAISNCICAMRKGFNSSRGAIRGTIGGAPVGRVGTGGFATVAISFGPFLCLCLKSPACCRAALLFVQESSGIGRELPRLNHKFVAAFFGAKEDRLSTAVFRDRQSFRQMHPADRIPHQFPGHRITRHINRLLPAGGGTAHAVHDSPQQGNAPRNDQDPKKKP